MAKAKKTTKKKGVVRRAIDKLRNRVGEMCMVQYHPDWMKWAKLDSKTHEALEGFEHGFMKHPHFKTMHVAPTRYAYCGVDGWIGVAEGELVASEYLKDEVGWRNLSFRGNGVGFLDENGQPLLKARALQLLPDRRAMYLL